MVAGGSRGDPRVRRTGGTDKGAWGRGRGGRGGGRGGRPGRRLGLALGGGAARGFAHIGVLKVLAEEGIRADLVAGTSAGSLVGALYCAGRSWEEIRAVGRDINWPDLVSPAWPTLGLARTDKLEAVIERHLQGRSFAELEIPFRAVAVDIQRGEVVVLGQGSVARAVRASASIPGIFEPTMWEGRYLVDGGLMDDVPADVVRDMGADVVLGVNLNRDRISTGPPQNMVDILLRSLNILIYQSTRVANRSVDLMVAPDLAGFAYQDMRRVDELVDRGEVAMRAHLRELQRLL
jgi:NTE family protein